MKETNTRRRIKMKVIKTNTHVINAIRQGYKKESENNDLGN